MQPTPDAPGDQEPTARRPLSARSILLLAAWFGLVGGLLDLGMIFVKRDVFHASLYYEQGRHFRWAIPAAHLLLMLAPGLAVAAICRLRPGRIGELPAAWLFATLALWGALLRAPLYGAATLALSAGAGRLIGRWVAAHPSGFGRFAGASLAAGSILVATTAATGLSGEARREADAIARLPAPAAGSSNVLLVVLDTVRAASLGLYGYDRDTSPHLARWAARGVRFERAQAPAPWTFPSHCSFMTGQWPSTLGAHWSTTVSPNHPTLAEFLAGRGYSTAGFAANTYWCSYESGMDRGFAHYEDYPFTPRNFLASTMPGRWILETLVHPGDAYAAKWIRTKSRDAGEINEAFLGWLDHARPAGRPFFAFLNYIDAHEPFMAPPGAGGRFGLAPAKAAERAMLLDYWDLDKLKLTERDVEMARDAYDDCIAALDEQVGSLLDDLDRRGLLRDTLVVITADHGEQFGEHGLFNHGYSLYSYETHVPLLVIDPRSPRGATVPAPVSLRDLPATIVELAGQASGSPFPGRSLSTHWSPETAPAGRTTSSALSEVDVPKDLVPFRGRGSNQRGFTMALSAQGRHYILGVEGDEELYDLATDPGELRNLKDSPGEELVLSRSRSLLRQALADLRGGEVAEGFRNRLRQFLDSHAPTPRP